MCLGQSKIPLDTTSFKNESCFLALFWKDSEFWGRKDNSLVLDITFPSDLKIVRCTDFASDLNSRFKPQHVAWHTTPPEWYEPGSLYGSLSHRHPMLALPSTPAQVNQQVLCRNKRARANCSSRSPTPLLPEWINSCWWKFSSSSPGHWEGERPGGNMVTSQCARCFQEEGVKPRKKDCLLSLVLPKMRK